MIVLSSFIDFIFHMVIGFWASGLEPVDLSNRVSLPGHNGIVSQTSYSSDFHHSAGLPADADNTV